MYTFVLGCGGLAATEAAALICTWSAILFVPAGVLLGLSRIPRAC